MGREAAGYGIRVVQVMPEAFIERDSNEDATEVALRLSLVDMDCGFGSKVPYLVR